MMARTAASLLLLLPAPVAGVRRLMGVEGEAPAPKAESHLSQYALPEGAKMIAGVPVYNYDFAFKKSRVESFLAMVKGETNPECDHFVLTFKPTVTQQEMDEIVEFAGVEFTGHASVAPFAEFRGTEDELEALLAQIGDKVKFTEPDGMITMDGHAEETHGPDGHAEEHDDDDNAACIWSLERIGSSSRKHRREHTGRGVHVYVMDTGIRTQHEDFGGRAIPTLDLATDRGELKVCEEDDGYCAKDYEGHGTHVAGTAVGKRFGVAPEAIAHAVQILDRKGSGSASWVFEAMDWIILNGQKPAVISLSVGMTGLMLSWVPIIEAATAAGFAIINAAGNDGKAACGYSPSFVVETISVAASTKDDEKSDFSNWGKCVTMFAPGSEIHSLSHTKKNGILVKSGTSMACPMVSGAAALILEENPEFSVAELKKKLEDNAQKDQLEGDIGKGSPNLLLSVVGDGKHPKCGAYYGSGASRTSGLVSLLAVLVWSFLA